MLMDKSLETQNDAENFDPRITKAYLWPLRPQYAGSWARWKCMMSLVIRQVTLMLFTCIVPLTVVCTGTDAFTVGANTVACFFLLDLDELAYSHLLTHDTRFKYETQGMINMSPAQYRDLKKMNRNTICVVLIDMLFGILASHLFYYKDWCHLTAIATPPLLGFMDAIMKLKADDGLSCKAVTGLAGRWFIILNAAVFLATAATQTVALGPLPFLGSSEYLNLGSEWNDYFLNILNWDP